VNKLHNTNKLTHIWSTYCFRFPANSPQRP